VNPTEPSSPNTGPANSPPGAPAGDERKRLGEVARAFLKLGVIGFGGPAAHLGLMEQEFVRRRQWVSHEKFADLLAASNLIPGPNSTEMAMWLGLARAGLPGLFVAGTCFILPAMLIVMGIAWVYQKYGALPDARAVLYGVKPVMIAIILQALWGLGRRSIRKPWQAVLALGALAAGCVDAHELLVLLGAGLCALLWLEVRRPRGGGVGTLMAGVVPAAGWAQGQMLLAVGGTVAAQGFGLAPLFLFFLKVGAVLYGSGYVLLAFLRADLVERWHWLSEAQLLDAVAVGQITPGPLFTTATFIGSVLGGVPGALVATVGIFLPAFIFVAVCTPLLPRLRASPRAGAFLDGVVIASLALMAMVTWHLGRAALMDAPTVVMAALAALVVLRWKVNTAWLVGAGALFGLAAARLGWLQ
jgi:chromate transporter